jgi:hypothetical protein
MTYFKKLCIVILFLFAGISFAFSQPGSEIEIKKPEKYETKTLRSEKTGEKKLILPKRILQNTTTHFNYYFNANQKMTQVLEKAKSSFKDDYTKLLPFYNYTLDGTAQQKNEIDSIILQVHCRNSFA